MAGANKSPTAQNQKKVAWYRMSVPQDPIFRVQSWARQCLLLEFGYFIGNGAKQPAIEQFYYKEV